MDAAGIDQVMIFPSTFVYLPLVENADAAYICARAYNDWAYDYCSADKKRLYPAAVLPMQNVDFAIEELRRVAKRGFKSALVRPIIAQGKYPTFPEYDPLWREFEELGMVLGMHTFPSRGEAMSPELDQRMGANRKRLFSATKTSWFIRRGSSSPTSCRSWAPNRPATRPMVSWPRR